MIKIGRFCLGIRAYGRKKFRWFYHPLLKCNEKANFKFFVWIGWHFYACMRLKKEKKYDSRTKT